MKLSALKGGALTKLTGHVPVKENVFIAKTRMGQEED
jgi:hypothetical protein